MRFPVWITLITAVIGFGLVIVIGQQVVQPPLPLIITADFDNDQITPNADGDTDITQFNYEISRNALVSLLFEAADGTRYYFREQEARSPQVYSVLFSGVVDGYVLPNETIPGTIERRLIPDGVYTWRFIAENEAETQEISGTFTIQDADSPLPILSEFTVGPTVFTPNQDGIEDRVEISVYLEKEADLRVYLLREDGVQVAISARKEGRLPGESGRHVFDYEGGVDLGADPPPDGTYPIIAVAQDAVGQRIRREAELTIVQGGKPLAEIAPQNIGVDVVFEVRPYDDRFFTDATTQGDLVTPPDNPADLLQNTLQVPLGDMLVFKLTIENYSKVHIRTTGPTPGTVYQQSQMAAALGAFQSPGAWRVGIQCDTSSEPFPYRWAIGSSDDLEAVEDPETGEIFYFLPPESRSVVWGAVRFTEIQERQNPQICRAGLIHEGVAVSVYNSYVGPREILLVDPNSLANVEDE